MLALGGYAAFGALASLGFFVHPQDAINVWQKIGNKTISDFQSICNGTATKKSLFGTNILFGTPEQDKKVTTAWWPADLASPASNTPAVPDSALTKSVTVIVTVTITTTVTRPHYYSNETATITTTSPSAPPAPRELSPLYDGSSPLTSSPYAFDALVPRAFSMGLALLLSLACFGAAVHVIRQPILQALEREIQRLQKQMAEKDARISTLEAQIEGFRASTSDRSVPDSPAVISDATLPTNGASVGLRDGSKDTSANAVGDDDDTDYSRLQNSQSGENNDSSHGSSETEPLPLAVTGSDGGLAPATALPEDTALTTQPTNKSTTDAAKSPSPSKPASGTARESKAELQKRIDELERQKDLRTPPIMLGPTGKGKPTNVWKRTDGPPPNTPKGPKNVSGNGGDSRGGSPFPQSRQGYGSGGASFFPHDQGSGYGSGGASFFPRNQGGGYGAYPRW